MKKEIMIITSALKNSEGSSMHMENTFSNRKLWYESKLFRYLMLSLNIFWGYKCIASEDPKKINVLFIVSDDLNDWVGYMGGHLQVQTPNIDELARRGIAFTNTVCASPLCAPSRVSFMTGRYPFNSGIYTNNQHIEERPDLLTIPVFLRQNGYHVMGAGKLFHANERPYPLSLFDEFGPGYGLSGGPFVDGELNSGLQVPFHKVDRGPGKLNAVLPLNQMPNDRPYNKYNTFDWGAVNVSDDEMPDGQIANWAVSQLQRQHEQKFFLGAGFIRPHIPLYAPQEYFELYPPGKVLLPKTIDNDLDDLPQTGKDFALLAATGGNHSTVVKYNQWRNATAAYLACVTFVDRQIGKILKALDSSPYANNTLIVFMGDNGWHLGEKEHWGKWTGWYRSSRVPFIIVPPKNYVLNGFKPGTRCYDLVSLIDIFPTIAEFLGADVNQQLDGHSLIPIIKGEKTSDNKEIITFGMGNNAVVQLPWYYIHYFDGSDELYNLTNDSCEWNNLANKKEYDNIKLGLFESLPSYPLIQHFIRFGPWKAVLFTDGKTPQLYNIMENAGIMETKNISGKNPEILDYLRKQILLKKPTEKYLNWNSLWEEYSKNTK